MIMIVYFVSSFVYLTSLFAMSYAYYYWIESRGKQSDCSVANRKVLSPDMLVASHIPTCSRSCSSISIAPRREAAR